MKYLRISALIILVTVFCCCKKGSSDGGSGTSDTPPTNLTVSAVVNADNSGNVAFTATATNAVSYDYDFGNGTYQTVASGAVTYKYPSSGTYTVNVIAKSSGGQTISKSTQVVLAISSAYTWSDEFNTDGAPDPAKWGYDLGGGGWGNAELEYYTNRTDNAIVSNGTLKIILKKESYSGSNYTSARLTSNTKFSFKYGKIEIRAKLPSGGGTWPAIWMLGSDYATNAWPACGEMDIMEQKGNDLNRIYGTLHYPNHSGGNGDGANTVISGAATDFHVYGLQWDATAMKISVDGVVFKTVANSSSVPFNHNFFFILNVAMGGTFGGAVDPAFTSGTMEIDYIRVTQ
ncbi:MAG: family 16 glycosylhydrolase [Bacteroidota bacterium]